MSFSDGVFACAEVALALGPDPILRVDQAKRMICKKDSLKMVLDNEKERVLSRHTNPKNYCPAQA